MRVLGVDPGLTRCGLGVVEGALGRPLTAVAVDVVRTAGRRRPRRPAGGDRAAARGVARQLPARRRRGRAGVRPAQRPHGDGHRAGAGVAIVAAARRGIPVALHTPSEVKAAVTGSGRADKAQVTAMVTRLLRLDRATVDPPTPPTRSRWRCATSGAGRPTAAARRRRVARAAARQEWRR